MADRSSRGGLEEDSAAELERALVTLATLERENADLCGKLGTPVEAGSRATSELRVRDRPHGHAAYRTADRRQGLEEELHAASARIVELGIENAILTNRALGLAKPRLRDRAVAIAAFLLLEAVIGFATGSIPVMVIVALVCLGGWALLRLIDAIKPEPHTIVLPPGDR